MRTPFIIFLLLLHASEHTPAQSISLVPQPRSIKVGQADGFAVPAQILVEAPAEWHPHLEVFASHVERLTHGRHQIRLAAGPAPQLTVVADASLDADSYTLRVAADSIHLAAASLKGLAHGTATLLQLFGNVRQTKQLPLLHIDDQPQTPYRSFMIDMGRNPHSVELLKETIDLLWYYKLDSLQLHLTDDQRFAWPSKAFPKLWDGKISLDQFRELETYATTRGVTLIPELEVPGHSTQLCSIYPETFGKNSAELATSAKALQGIKALLDEMMEVFASSPYVHIGGDEAYGVPEEAQRNLINQLHSYLDSKGRQTIVWEGPAAGLDDNRVHPDVIHINWRTIAYRADQMLQDGYRVVNAAWDPLYIVDHYPRTNFTMTTPQHIYETLQLTRFKHVNPGIPTFGKPLEVSPNDQLIGFCMPWWEGREENYFSQIVPRLIPFAAVAWNSLKNRDYGSFEAQSTATEQNRLAAFYPVRITSTPMAIPSDGVFHRQTSVSLEINRPYSDASIRYTLDGSAPAPNSALYTEPIVLTNSTVIRAAAFVKRRQIGHASRRKLTAVDPRANLALGKTVTSSAPSASPFSVERLTDGGIHNLNFYLGYPAEPEPIQITIDLEQVHQIDKVITHAYSISNSFEKHSVATSIDGKHFDPVGSQFERPDVIERPDAQSAVPTEFQFAPRDVRYVRVTTNGNKGYVFDSFSKLVEVQVFGIEPKGAIAANLLQPASADYSQLAFYPNRWNRDGVSFEFLAWEGQHVVFLTQPGEYKPSELSAFVHRLDEGWEVYSELVGQQPKLFKSFNGKPTICAVPSANLTCGYGCGFVGYTGIEAAAFYSVDLPNFRKVPESFQHYYFYEMGRNFFVFGDRHSLFTTGYAVFMRYVCMDRLQCKDLDLKTRQTIEACEEIFANSSIGFYDAFTNFGSGEKSNRLRAADGRVIRPSDQPVMYATAMLKLRRDYGGDKWVKRFFHALLQCESTPAEDIPTSRTQIYNWLVSASVAAAEDLTPIFADRWRMPFDRSQREIMRKTDWTSNSIDVRGIVSALLDP